MNRNGIRKQFHVDVAINAINVGLSYFIYPHFNTHMYVHMNITRHIGNVCN